MPTCRSMNDPVRFPNGPRDRFYYPIIFDRTTENEAIMSLTNRPLDVVSGTDRPARQNDTDEAFEITEEMIEAAHLAVDDHVAEFRLEDGGVIVTDDLLRIIFTAMTIAKR